MVPDFSSADTLHTIDQTCWHILQAAVSCREHGWRCPVLATEFAGSVRQRTVILRDVDPENREIFCHTDVRSPKIVQLRENPRVSMLFYDSRLGAQLQILGRAEIHTDTQVADRLWQQSPPESLRSCLAPYAPGTHSIHPCDNLPDSVRGRIPERQELRSGRSRFAVVRIIAEQADWLLLSRDGNRRATFGYSPGKEPVREWLCP